MEESKFDELVFNDIIGEINGEVSTVTRKHFEEVFKTLENLYDNEETDDSLMTSALAARDIAFQGMTVEFFLQRWNEDDLKSNLVREMFAGAFLMDAKIKGSSLRDNADRYEITDYLRHETVLGELSIDEWKIV